MKLLLDENLSPDELRGMFRMRQAEIEQSLQLEQARLIQVEARLRFLEQDALRRFAHQVFNKGGKGAHDGHEARQDDGLAAVLLIEGVRTVQVFLLQEADLPAECAWADVVTDPVVHRVAQHRCHHQQDPQHPDI